MQSYRRMATTCTHWKHSGHLLFLPIITILLWSETKKGLQKGNDMLEMGIESISSRRFVSVVSAFLGQQWPHAISPCALQAPVDNIKVMWHNSDVTPDLTNLTRIIHPNPSLPRHNTVYTSCVFANENRYVLWSVVPQVDLVLVSGVYGFRQVWNMLQAEFLWSACKSIAQVYPRLIQQKIGTWTTCATHNKPITIRMLRSLYLRYEDYLWYHVSKLCCDQYCILYLYCYCIHHLDRLLKALQRSAEVKVWLMPFTSSDVKQVEQSF